MRAKKLYIFLIILFYVFTIKGQYSSEIKSLLKNVKEASFFDSTNLFKTGEETIQKALLSENDKGAVAEVYLYYGSYFYYTRDIIRSKQYFTKSITEAEKTNNYHIATLSNIRLMFIDHESGLNPDLEKDFNTLLIQAKQKKDYESAAEIINFLGIIKEGNNKTKEAAKLYIKGLSFAEAHSINHYPAVFRNNLGLIKLYTNQIDDALIDFEKGLELAKKENDKNLASHIQINICLIYVSKNKIAEALKVFNEVIEYTRVNNHPRELSAAFINLASAFNNHDNHTMALSYADSAINVLQKHSLNLELTKAYLGKTEILIGLKKNKEARENLNLALQLANKTGNLEDKASYNFLLYSIEKEEKNYNSALTHFLSYQNIKDSIEKNVSGKIIQELQLKYNVQKKEVELEKEKSKYLLLEKKNQDERFFKWLSIAIAIIVLISVISFISYFYSLKLREKQASFSRQLIENIEEDRLRISMDLHDDIGQSLSMIKSKISHTKRNQDDKQLEDELSRVIEQTREISRNLYPSYLEKIGLVRSIARLTENIQASSKLECSFEVTETVEVLSIVVKTHIYRILQECSNNTIKHSKATALKISISEKDGHYLLIYQDNGIGITAKQKNGLGLLSIQERTKIINGTVSFDNKSNKSFKLTLKFNA
jgi:two-component system, NarL family, sensor kinase